MKKNMTIACKKAEKAAKVWEINSINRIKKENELKAKLYKEKLDRIRLGIHKELNPHHSSPGFPSRNSLKDPSRSKQ